MSINGKERGKKKDQEDEIDEKSKKDCGRKWEGYT